MSSEVARADLVPRYHELRAAGVALNGRLMKVLSKKDAETGGRALGLFRRGSVELESKEMASIFMDYCLFDVRRDGINAVERFAAEFPPAEGSIDEIVLRSLFGARYTLVVVESVERGVGVHYHDLLADRPGFLHDVGMSRTADRDILFATRLIAPEGITMTTGAALPCALVPSEKRGQLLELAFRGAGLRPGREMSAIEASRFSASMIRTALAAGAGERMRYEDSRVDAQSADPSRPHFSAFGRPRMALASGPPAGSGRVGRNESCPCGSGRKYKHCCGAS